MQLTRRTSTGTQRRYKKGQHYMVSDQSGFVYRAEDIVRQWDGLLVGKDEEEKRHPQEFVRGVVDDYAVRNPRPRVPIDVALSTGNTVNDRTVAPNTLVAERDGDFVRERIDEAGVEPFVFIRGTPQYFLSLLEVDLGSIKEVSHVLLTMTVFTPAARPYVSIYTSEDGVDYEAVSDLQQDIIERITLGTEVRVMVGNRARYVRIGYRPPFNQFVQYNVTQFDIYGS